MEPPTSFQSAPRGLCRRLIIDREPLSSGGGYRLGIFIDSTALLEIVDRFHATEIFTRTRGRLNIRIALCVTLYEVVLLNLIWRFILRVMINLLNNKLILNAIYFYEDKFINFCIIFIIAIILMLREIIFNFDFIILSLNLLKIYKYFIIKILILGLGQANQFFFKFYLYN